MPWWYLRAISPHFQIASIVTDYRGHHQTLRLSEKLISKQLNKTAGPPFEPQPIHVQLCTHNVHTVKLPRQTALTILVIKTCTILNKLLYTLWKHLCTGVSNNVLTFTFCGYNNQSINQSVSQRVRQCTPKAFSGPISPRNKTVKLLWSLRFIWVFI